jgi:hypothetical protein
VSKAKVKDEYSCSNAIIKRVCHVVNMLKFICRSIKEGKAFRVWVRSGQAKVEK